MTAPAAVDIPWRLLVQARYPMGVIPVEDIATEFLGLSPKYALEKSAAGELGLPAFKLGAQKSRWVVSVDDFVDHVERRASQAREAFARTHNAS